jgi:hypothetical protein
MENIIISFLLSFNSEWDFIDSPGGCASCSEKVDVGSILADYSKKLYVDYKKEFNKLLLQTKDITDIRSMMEELIIIHSKSETLVMLGLTFLGLVFDRFKNGGIDKDALIQEIIVVNIIYLYPLMHNQDWDRLIEYCENSTNYKQGIKQLKNIF